MDFEEFENNIFSKGDIKRKLSERPKKFKVLKN